MIIETLSTFPNMYDSVMGASMMKRAQEKGLLDFCAYDLRDWTYDRHRTTDDDPYGGGPGLIMRCEPIFRAYEAITGEAFEGLDTLATEVWDAREITGAAPRFSDAPKPFTIFLTPWGLPFNDEIASDLATKGRLLFICGHYEGIDERAYSLADACLSVGDYVLTSGELASMVIIDAVVRKIPGVLGAPDGAVDESFANGLLEGPTFTRPASFCGMEVPEVLLSGNHEAIASWRLEQAILRTEQWRPDLLP